MANHIIKSIITYSWILLLLPSSYIQAKDLIKIEGSSTVYPITQQLAKQYMLAEGSRTQVVVGITGTGGGFRKFCRGRTDISNASRPIKASEIALCKANGIEFLELPVALDAITVVVNKQNDWVNSLSLKQLEKIWSAPSQSAVNSWYHVDSGYPPYPIALHGPGSDSGTYDYFVNVILNKEPSRQDYKANEDDNAMAAEVAADKYAMAFLGFAYYLENRDQLKAIAIENEAGRPIVPSVENVTDGLYSALSRPLFLYVNKSALDSRNTVKQFLNHYFQAKNINRVVKKSGYIPLSANMYSTARNIMEQGKTGSVFNSDDMSANFEQLLHQK
ncbi:PstS family phosphate ABC transporter substrate-binding protein [Vibrio alginolyticus]